MAFFYKKRYSSDFFLIFPTMDTEKKIALIIDCDNAKADAIYGIMEELSKFGEC